MLKVEGLSVSIGSSPIIRDASLFMTEGQMCGLIGRKRRAQPRCSGGAGAEAKQAAAR